MSAPTEVSSFPFEELSPSSALCQSPVVSLRPVPYNTFCDLINIPHLLYLRLYNLCIFHSFSMAFIELYVCIILFIYYY